jgi:hypothetical protein
MDAGYALRRLLSYNDDESGGTERAPRPLETSQKTAALHDRRHKRPPGARSKTSGLALLTRA